MKHKLTIGVSNKSPKSRVENVKEDDFDIDSELQKPAFSKKGDIWLLGKHD